MAAAALLCALALMSGCATADFSMRTLPAETPAADNAAAIKRMQELQAARAAMTTPADGHGATEPAGIGPPLTPADVPSLQTYDPWERMNRFTYRFNARLDEAFVLPVTDQYRRLPEPASYRRPQLLRQPARDNEHAELRRSAASRARACAPSGAS